MDLDPDISALIIRDPLLYGRDELFSKDWNHSQSSPVQDNRHSNQQMEASCADKTRQYGSTVSQITVELDKNSSRESRREKRKILPSSDLLSDCDIDPTLKSLQPTDPESSSGCGDGTPNYPGTPDSTDDEEVFDNELEMLGSPTSSNSFFASGGDGGRQVMSKEQEENESWRTVLIGDKEHRIDLKVIEPYKRVISHGGYYGDGFNSIIVLTVCYLPDKRRHDYQYVMRNLFLYVISTLELLVMDEYTVVYFHGAAPRQKVPSFRWLRQIYETIDRKFKKNLKQLLIVHPTFFLRTIMLMTKPFLSPKFNTKLKYIRSLEELGELLPMDHIYIPKEILAYNADRTERNSIGET